MDDGAPSRFRRVLLTGPPGIGKTTICKKLATAFERQARRFDGFYTEEVRQGNRRIGFDVVVINDREKKTPLARVEGAPNWHYSRHRVGNYHVFVENFEAVALPVLKCDADVLLIDEIGKMELFSREFHDRIVEIFFGSTDKKCNVVATVPQIDKVPRKFSSLFERLHSDDASKIVTVDYKNRDSLSEQIVGLIS